MINAVHEIDTLQHLFGRIGRVASIAGSSDALSAGVDVEHSLVITMEFERGPVATAVFSDECPSPYSYESTVAAGTAFPQYPMDCYHFFGSLGSLAFPSFTVHRAETESSSWFQPLSGVTLSEENAEVDDPLSREIELFSRVISDRIPPHATIDDAIRNLAVIESIRRSLTTSVIERVCPTTALPHAASSRCH